MWHNRHAMRNILAALVFLSPLALVAAGDAPNHPTGTTGLLMVDKLGGHVRFFDPATMQERSNLKLPANPHDFVFSSDHKLAYVPIYGPGVYGRNPNPQHHLYVLDLGTRAVSKVIDLSPYKSPHGIQIAPDGTVYVTAELDRKIVQVDPVRGRVIGAIDVEGSAHWMAILPDGSKMYVANKDDRLFVSVVDLKTKKIVARVPMAKGTQGITASPDGRAVIAMDLAAPVLAVIDPKTDQVTERITLQGQIGCRLQGLLLARRQVAADHGGVDDHDLRRVEPERAAEGAEGGGVPDGHRLLGRRHHGAGGQPRRRHGIGAGPGHGAGHQDVQGGNRDRDAGVLLKTKAKGKRQKE